MIMLTHEDVSDLTEKLALYLRRNFPDYWAVYGVPRGGIPVVYRLAGYGYRVVETPIEAEIIVDDVIDSGRTRDRYESFKPFVALIDKTPPSEFEKKWIVFPWEKTEADDAHSVHDNIIRLLSYVGEDPNREGLQKTPDRVVKAWDHWTSGYKLDPKSILKTFVDGSAGYDEMVVVKDIPFYSNCEHHLAPFFGTASVAYIPHGRIVGLSKLSRLVDMYARRLQVQERMTNQIANALDEHLEPLGAGVILRARHMCLESRGVSKQGQMTVTCALRGAIKDKPAARAEFIELTR